MRPDRSHGDRLFAIPQHYIGHGAILVMAQGHLETWHMFPAGNGIDETRMYVSLYIPQPALTDSARRHWNDNFDLLMATVENQDFPVSEGIQRGFYSGAQEEIMFGRNEPALQHYRRAIRAALAPPADE
jgi:Ring hydroxylating alpha subunit (catalytic domain)